MSKIMCDECGKEVCVTVSDVWKLLNDGITMYIFSYDCTAKYFYAAGIKGVCLDYKSRFYRYFDFEVLSINLCEDDSIYVQIPHIRNSIYNN